MSGEWQVEMLWRCAACGHENLGRHVACQRCGKPKTGAEEYEMPSDTSRANAVRDADLVRMATAGANWRCRYCGSDQRRFDGACARCGAAQREGRDLGGSPWPPTPPHHYHGAPAPAAWVPRRGIGATGILGALAVLVAALFMCCGVAMLRDARGPLPALIAPAYRDVSARVTAISWEHSVQVERWVLVAHEGFAEEKPADAVGARVVGQRVHHFDKVPDGFQTEKYTETVPDGTRTETYTEEERCGETCTPRPQTCQRKCTPNGNGFATCKDVCTGGGEDCKPKMCTRTKTREIPKTKTVTKTRQVPRYRDVLRHADWWSWRSWEWTLDRVVSERGESADTRWPSADKVKLGANGHKEREQRSSRYEVRLATGDGQSFTLQPAAAAELARFGVGSPHTLRVWDGGRVSCVDEEVRDAGAR